MKKLLLITLSITFIMLSACNKSTNEANSESNNEPTQQIENHSSTELEKEKPPTDEGKPTDSTTRLSKKETYFQKLNEIKKELESMPEATTTVEMEEAQSEEYRIWDAALNEIYGVLKEQLSSEQMDKLRAEQQQWIKDRDEGAKEASLMYEGGSMESLEYVATQARLTEERCYELVEVYIQ